MRVSLLVDDILQVNNVFHVSVCDPDTLFLRVDGCSWDIVVHDIPDPLLCIRRLLVYDYLDLTDHFATFLTLPEEDDNQDKEQVIQSNAEKEPSQEEHTQEILGR